MEEVKEAALSGKYNLIPVYKEIFGDFDTPTGIFSRVKDNKYAFLLESVSGGETLARNSFIGFDPYRILRVNGGSIKIIENGKEESVEAEKPLDYLQQLLSSYHAYESSGLPAFCGGAVGFFSYDSIRFIENIPDSNDEDFSIDEIFFVFTDKLIIFDHIENKIQLVYNIHVDERKGIEKQYKEAEEQIEKMHEIFRQPLPKLGNEELDLNAEDIKMDSNFSKEDFCDMVEKAKEHIYQGDIFQVVLSQRFSADRGNINPLNIYRALRLINPSPYMFYLKFDDIDLIGASPEILVRQTKGEAVLRPIAGTRHRGSSEEDDKALAEELLKDEKELAEHLMLVDLGRNDLGRVCEYSSIEVDDFEIIEKYAHVMHIVSNVRGRLAEGKGNIDLIKSCFPAGTLSGAPKVRAMEIIDNLENKKRGPYGGCVGYFSFNSDMDTAIMIRTIYIKGDKIYLQAGAGIVFDSDPETEYIETLNKAKSLIKAISLAKQIDGEK